MRLLLDLGNTRLKWQARTCAGEVVAEGALHWQADVAGLLCEDWRHLPGVQVAYVASVVDAAREAEVAAAIQATCGIEPVSLRTPAAACGVTSAYVEPARLGIDRFLAMVAAHAHGHTPCIVAGLGTALTLDAVRSDGRHLGGLIAPGPVLMQRALSEAAARLVWQPGTLHDLADNTADAIVSGCWQAAAALVERFAARTAASLGGVPTVVLGGGDADTLVPLLSVPSRLMHDIVLRGLAVWADAQRPV